MIAPEIHKPKCQLPSLLTSSHLIGNTIVTLRNAGDDRTMREFINEIKRKDIELDFQSVLQIAQKYVDFDN